MESSFSTTFHEILSAVADAPSESLESETLEFKEYSSESALHNSKDLTEEISALANTCGGHIIIGIRDSSNVSHGDWAQQLVGMSPIDPLQTKARLTGRLRPEIDLSIANADHEGTNYVILTVPHPRHTLVSTTSGKTCIRDGRSSRPMSPAEIEAAVKELQTYDWSGDCLDLDPVGSLDPEALDAARRDFARRREIDETLTPLGYLEAIGATKNGSLTKAGLLFLGRRDLIRNVLGDYEFRFSWKERTGTLRVNDVWSGSLWDAINRAHLHFDECNDEQEYKYKEKTFTVPLLDRTAFHEAYLNALVHRDYSTDGMVAVNYGTGQIVISSPGIFYGGITASNIALHEPRHRNKALARVLMAHNLVDRAGMGVLRMGLGSLRYGRSFPIFRETSDSIEVVMEAQYLKPPIAVLALENSEVYGISELAVLNLVHETGVVSVPEVIDKLDSVSTNPWADVTRAIDNLDPVELCGSNSGVYIRVVPQWKGFMNVGRIFRPSTNSEKHVALFSYLLRHGEASNADLREVLGHSHSSQTSRFLRDAKYVTRHGSGPRAVWRLTIPLGHTPE